MYQSRNAKLYPGRAAKMCRETNVEMFQKEYALKCQAKLVDRYQRNNVDMFQSKLVNLCQKRSVNRSVIMFIGVKSANEVQDMEDVHKSITGSL